MPQSNFEVRILALERALSKALLDLAVLQTRMAASEQTAWQGWVGTPSGGSSSPVGIFPAVAGTGGVPVRSGNTVGTAIVTLQTLGGTNLANGQTVTVNNHLVTAVGANKNLLVGADANGVYWVVNGDC